MDQHYTGLVMYNSENKHGQTLTPKNQTITQLHDTGEDNTLYYSSWDNALYELTWSQQPEQARTIHLHNSNAPIYRIEGEANKLLIGTWGEGIKVYIKSKSVFIHHPAQNIWVPLLSMPFIKIALITSPMVHRKRTLGNAPPQTGESSQLLSNS